MKPFYCETDFMKQLFIKAIYWEYFEVSNEKPKLNITNVLKYFITNYTVYNPWIYRITVGKLFFFVHWSVKKSRTQTVLPKSISVGIWDVSSEKLELVRWLTTIISGKGP